MPLFLPPRCYAIAGGILLAATAALARTEPTDGPVPLDALSTDESAVFPSGFNHQGIGDGGVMHSAVDYTRRFPWTDTMGHWFWQAGISGERFDFGGVRRGPLPGTLQTINFPLGIVNITQEHIGFLAQVRPGFYFEHDLSRGAFDVPLEVGSYWPLLNEKLYLAWGFRAALLQHYIVFPTAGLIWVITPDLILYGHLPEPRLEYTPSDKLALWAGGEVLGGSYKMDSDTGERFSGTVVEYYEVRAGAGATFTPVKYWNIKLAAGVACERKLDFYRADQSYIADPAPYVRLQVSAEF